MATKIYSIAIFSLYWHVKFWWNSILWILLKISAQSAQLIFKVAIKIRITYFCNHFRPVKSVRGIILRQNFLSSLTIHYSDDPEKFISTDPTNLAMYFQCGNKNMQYKNRHRLVKKIGFIFFGGNLCSELKTTWHQFDIKKRAPSL